MANIPCIAALSLIFVSVYGFHVPHINENPDLIIDEDLNLVEPKVDFWNVMLRPKAKTTFKSILKFLKALDSRDRYSINDEHVPEDDPNQESPILSDIIVVKKDEVSIRNGEEQAVIPDEPAVGIVSGEARERESLSEEHPTRIAVESISMESNEKSENSDESSKKETDNISEHSESSQSSSEEYKEKNGKPESTNEPKVERLRQLEALRYEADVPKSLHHFETNKPRYQHSIRDGWIY